jgi:hypothetical protein
MAVRGAAVRESRRGSLPGRQRAELVYRPGRAVEIVEAVYTRLTGRLVPE